MGFIAGAIGWGKARILSIFRAVAEKEVQPPESNPEEVYPSYHFPVAVARQIEMIGMSWALIKQGYEQQIRQIETAETKRQRIKDLSYRKKKSQARRRR